MIGMAAGVLCTLLLLVSQSHPPSYFSRSGGPGGPGGSPHSLSLQAKIEHQEEVYVGVVQSRHALIRKFGPTPEKLAT